jgi:CubicO group peptidase (beta-lactamase class C family)
MKKALLLSLFFVLLAGRTFAQPAKPVYERAVGWSDKEAGRRMTAGTIFRIASQTKAITSTAVLALMEEGKIGLNEPVGHFIPTFTKTTVAVRGENGITTVPARRAITIQDLLTHTAGISYGTESHVAGLYEGKGLGPAAGNGWYTADKEEPICETMERLGTLPFVAQPGEAFVYGYNTDILGCVVEKASGMPLDEFVRTRISSFRPPSATAWLQCMPAAMAWPSAPPTGRRARVLTSMARAKASPEAPASPPPPAITRVSWK